MLNFKYKNVLVVGLKRSGISAINFLSTLKAHCFAFDENVELMHKLSNANLPCTFVNKINEDVLSIMDYMVISPSVSVFSEIVKLAELKNIKVLSELEVGCSFIKGKLVGITGTNGKTTTTSLVGAILNEALKPNVVVGNIGEPITKNIVPFKRNYVTEISSFQLEKAETIHPKIAGILNVTENHLDRHFSLQNYFNVKCNIFKNMTKKDTLVLNYDDPLLRELKNKKLKPKLIWFSTKEHIDGYVIMDNYICHKKGKYIEKIVCVKDVNLIGEHNLSNVLCAVAISKLLKVKNIIIVKAIKQFMSIEHRLQFIKNVNGVSYVNDSKSTTPNSSITAISCFKNNPIILMLGGSDKNLCFDSLTQKLGENIKLCVVCGDTTKAIVKSFKKFKFKRYIVAEDFDSALKISSEKSIEGDVVLLSPACASFDYFKNFEERGNYFIKYVEGLGNIES